MVKLFLRHNRKNNGLIVMGLLLLAAASGLSLLGAEVLRRALLAVQVQSAGLAEVRSSQRPGAEFSGPVRLHAGDAAAVRHEPL